ncbi:MAG: PAS domain-containing protein, partial [Myxococcales bacterium]
MHEVPHLHDDARRPVGGEDPRAPGRERAGRGEPPARRVRAFEHSARASRRTRDRSRVRHRCQWDRERLGSRSGKRRRAVDHRECDGHPLRGGDRGALARARRIRPSPGEVRSRGVVAGNLSLLSFLDAPVLVGDPEGRAAYVNPAFESRFGVSAEGVSGQALAALFDGGRREGMLRAVAEACERGTTARFQLRHAGVNYAAVASPIVAEDARVGVVVVLVESGATEERLRALGTRVHQSCQELAGNFALLTERLASQGPAERALAEDCQRALVRLRAVEQELQGAL